MYWSPLLFLFIGLLILKYDSSESVLRNSPTAHTLNTATFDLHCWDKGLVACARLFEGTLPLSDVGGGQQDGLCELGEVICLVGCP